MPLSLSVMNYVEQAEISVLNINFRYAQKEHPVTLNEFDSKKRKAEHRPTPGEKRHTGGSSTQALESSLATTRPKALPQSRIDRLIVNFVVADLQFFRSSKMNSFGI